MSEDELTAIQEELAATLGELEQLQVTAADREARAAHLESQLGELDEELAKARSEAEARALEQGAVTETNEALQKQLQDAAQRYRALALQHSPELPAELVAGETVKEIDQSLQQARETVSKVRGHLESQAQAGRVPVGAPTRSGPDFSALNAEEKIRRGLEQGGR